MNKKCVIVTLTGLMLGASQVTFAEDNQHSDSSFTDSAQETMHEVTDSAQDTMHEMSDSAQDTMDEMTDEMADMGVATVILAKYAKDPLISFFQIDVNVESDKVMLEGQVDTDMQFERAVMLAYHTDGVNEVDASSLSVKQSENAPEDLALNAQVKSEISKLDGFQDSNIEDWTIQSETKNGVVYLTGTVDSEDARDQIIETVQSLDKVDDLQSDIQVNGSGF